MMKDPKVANDDRTKAAPADGARPARERVWRGPAELGGSAEQAELLAREFPPGASELHLADDGVSRRRFMGLMGASAAFAGAAMTGCIRKPKERIVPMAERPEDLIPGRPRYFRTAFHVGQRVLGLQVESQDGRPTKIEGNPAHPMSFGRTDHWSQASLLGLYDPQRLKVPHRNGNPSTWPELARFLSERASEATGGIAFVMPPVPSPSLVALAGEVKQKLPNAQFYLHDPMATANEEQGRALVGGAQFTPYYELDKAAVVLCIDADIFGTDGDAVRNAYQFMRGREVVDETSEMNRLYAVEPGLTVTGMSSDNRLAIPASECGGFLALVAQALGTTARVPAAQQLSAAVDVQSVKDLRELGLHAAWVAAVAGDLAKAGARAAVMVGARQPAWVHALAHAINQALGSECVRWAAGAPVLAGAGDLARFVEDAKGGRIGTAFFLDSNPVYTAPADLDLETALRRIEASVHVTQHMDETALALVQMSKTSWLVPLTHYLESWGDLRASDGTISLQQPLIAPLWQAISMHELLGALGGGQESLAALAALEAHDAGHAVVKRFYTTALGVSEDVWRQALHAGLFPARAQAGQPRIDPTEIGRAVGMGLGRSKRPQGQLELVFGVDYAVADGRFSSNSWLQEMPDPTTKLTWDNALLMGPKTAQGLGVTSGNTVGTTYKGDLVDIQVGDRIQRAAVMVLPGVAEGVMILPLGYGRARSMGEVAALRGFDAYRLRTSETLGWAHGVAVRAVGEQYPLATTQEHWSLSPREGYEERRLVEYFTRDEFAAQPEVLLEEWNTHMHHIREDRLYAPPAILNEGQQWAMTIDLTKCTGCSACMVACQAENNIPVVGKERVLNGREMHWLRVDRYFTGTYEQPGRPVTMPVPCMQCETAPCEQVCPVAATQHSPDGLNDMAYNRCIGTRYCQNNCPYKVRRFNFFNYQKELQEANPLMQLVRNPDVTVRFRGVIEKCTYCTQRITEARIRAKVHGNGVIPDGGVLTACQQACPTNAIVFGDFNDPATAISQSKRNKRGYMLLAYLNTLPRTTYLAQIRNPHAGLST